MPCILLIALLAALPAAGLAATFEGRATGAWVEPIGSYGFAIDNRDAGATADLDWGTPTVTPFNNLWRFDGAGSDGGPGWSAPLGGQFSLGAFCYRNGSTIDHDFTGATLSLTLDIFGPTPLRRTFGFGFDAINTLNTSGDPVADADVVRLLAGTESHVFVQGGGRYALRLLGFSRDGAAPVTSFLAAEGTVSTATLVARITPVPVPVPVPGALPLLFGALAPLVAAGRVRARARPTRRAVATTPGPSRWPARCGRRGGRSRRGC